jgi:hypothetical protein
MRERVRWKSAPLARFYGRLCAMNLTKTSRPVNPHHTSFQYAMTYGELHPTIRYNIS